MGKDACAVHSCYHWDSRKHSFPHPTKNITLFNKWLEACGNPELFNLPPMSVHKNRKVCTKHFLAEQFGTNGVLLRTAYPIVYLPNAQMKNISAVASFQQIATSEIVEDFDKPGPSHISVPESPDTNNLVHLPTTPPRHARTGILASVNVSRQSDLTPKAKKLYSELNKVRGTEAKLKKLRQSFKVRFNSAKKCATSKAFLKMSSLGSIQDRFFKSQMANALRKTRGRRYTMDDKILALALQKQSGNGYKLLSNVFALPSRATLTRFLQRVNVRPGLNVAILDVLKGETECFTNALDKYCLLSFDEMAIAPHLSWNRKEDLIEGFENFGEMGSNVIANHVQVFMLHGINKKWKQPIFYSFVNAATKSTSIVRILKKVIRATKNAGLHIIATVCDQGSNNVAAVHSLIASTASDYLRNGKQLNDSIFEIDGSVIIPLFDGPHLIKGIRNNFLKYNVQFTMDGKAMTAKWEHLVTAWQMDDELGNLRMMPKVTGSHVDPAYIRKMKVSCCTQALSRSMAVTINILAKRGISSNNVYLPEMASETATFVHFCDELFDSINGSKMYSRDGKALRMAVTATSIHDDFWTKAIKVLSSVKFQTNKGLSSPPTIKNFIMSLKNFKLLFYNMTKYGFKSMAPRTFNQDGLENFFGSIRQRGARFVNPTAAAFTPFYKSLLVNNLTKKHSIGNNCENDNLNMFVTLERLLTQGSGETLEFLEFNPPTTLAHSSLDCTVLAYVAGFVMKRILRKYELCSTCKLNVCSSAEDRTSSFHEFTNCKEYGGAVAHRLQYISKVLYNAMVHLYHLVRTMLPHILHHRGFYKYLIKHCLTNINFNFEKCDHTDRLIGDILQGFLKIMIYNYIRHINNIIQGKNRRNVSTSADALFIAARRISQYKKV